MVIRFGLVVAVLVASTTAFAQAPDPAAGRALAERWCAACHVVSAGQARGSDTGPTFADIALNPMWWEPARLGELLARPHRAMPGFAVTQRDAADLAAFLATQRR